MNVGQYSFDELSGVEHFQVIVPRQRYEFAPGHYFTWPVVILFGTSHEPKQLHPCPRGVAIYSPTFLQAVDRLGERCQVDLYFEEALDLALLKQGASKEVIAQALGESQYDEVLDTLTRLSVNCILRQDCITPHIRWHLADARGDLLQTRTRFEPSPYVFERLVTGVKLRRSQWWSQFRAFIDQYHLDGLDLIEAIRSLLIAGIRRNVRYYSRRLIGWPGYTQYSLIYKQLQKTPSYLREQWLRYWIPAYVRLTFAQLDREPPRDPKMSIGHIEYWAYQAKYSLNHPEDVYVPSVNQDIIIDLTTAFLDLYTLIRITKLGHQPDLALIYAGSFHTTVIGQFLTWLSNQDVTPPGKYITDTCFATETPVNIDQLLEERRDRQLPTSSYTQDQDFEKLIRSTD